MNRRIKNVCIVDSAYSLLIFLLYKSKEIDETFFFVSSGVPREVSDNLKHTYRYKKFKSVNLSRAYLLYVQLIKRVKWQFLSNSEFYGADHLSITSCLLGNKKITVIEDGLINYKFPTTLKRLEKLKTIFFGRLYSADKFGDNDSTAEVILTGLEQVDFPAHMNIKYVSLDEMWSKLSDVEKTNISSIFNITSTDMERLSNKTEILFTQCLSEDNLVSEERKIEIYKELIKSVNLENLIIKPHPRETTDYENIFEGAVLFSKKIPMQLITLMGIKFKKCYTVCSTVAFSFPYELEIVMTGSEIEPKIAETYGVIRSSDLKNNKRF